MYNEYVINAKSWKGDWRPIDTAPTKDIAIKKAQEYLLIMVGSEPLYQQIEVVYSPIDWSEDTVVWSDCYNTVEVDDDMFWDDMETGILDDDEEDF